MPYKYAYDESAEKTYQPPKMPTNRKMWKLVLLSIVTLGIYGIFFFVPFSYDLDKISPRRDGSRTMSYALAYFLSMITFSIVMIIWHYQIASRIEQALSERGIAYDFGTSTFWGWYFFGTFILVGPFIYFHKLCTAMNLLCEDYNKNPAPQAA